MNPLIFPKQTKLLTAHFGQVAPFLNHPLHPTYVGLAKR